ncbi:MAG TPA: hypothetical protein VL418_14885 [Devosiaceae bacterium]|jgi:hypothetical protein|nr:hypothetical protein [Devosiaceae bacterium]
MRLNYRVSTMFARVCLVALLFGSAIAAEPVVAAPFNPFQDFRDQGGRGGGPPFNIDQDPCAPGGRRDGPGARRGQDCYAPPAYRDRGGRNDGRRPGSNAFGLQFNDGY